MCVEGDGARGGEMPVRFGERHKSQADNDLVFLRGLKAKKGGQGD